MQLRESQRVCKEYSTDNSASVSDVVLFFKVYRTDFSKSLAWNQETKQLKLARPNTIHSSLNWRRGNSKTDCHLNHCYQQFAQFQQFHLILEFNYEQ